MCINYSLSDLKLDWSHLVIGEFGDTQYRNPLTFLCGPRNVRSE